MFQLSLHNRFEVLQSNEAETVEQRWSTFKKAVAGACEDVLGQAHFRRKPWISDESWKKMEKRRLTKQEMNQAKTRQQQQQASDRHSALPNEVRKSYEQTNECISRLSLMKQRRRLARAISRLCMPPAEPSVDDTVIQTGL